MIMNRHAFVLLSGGLDSTVALGHVVAQYARGYTGDVTAISIDYGQRHVKELLSAAEVAKHYGVGHRVIKIADVIGNTMLTDPNVQLPNASYADLPEGISPTYVPFRNGLMLSVLASVAQAWVKKIEEENANYTAQAIVAFGAHAEDAENWAYPDCTPEFIGSMANAIFIGTYQKVRLVAPLMLMEKEDIVRLGNIVGAPFEMTWSCYAGGELHCGTCPTCRARKTAFDRAQIDDPTQYAA